MPYNTPNFWIGLILGFGILAAMMLVSTYFFLKSIGELKERVTRVENRIEDVDKKVGEILKSLEEI